MNRGFNLKCFKQKYRVDSESGCWIWTGTKIWNGYGVYSGQVAHRKAYEIFVGPVPDGLDLDHLCRNRGCVNPAHLEPVTRSVNLRRGFEATGCKNGHGYSTETITLIHTSSGQFHRRCIICHREQNRRAKRRKRELEKLSTERRDVHKHSV